VEKNACRYTRYFKIPACRKLSPVLGPALRGREATTGGLFFTKNSGSCSLSFGLTFCSVISVDFLSQVNFVIFFVFISVVYMYIHIYAVVF
jgi:hypothetical protein